MAVMKLELLSMSFTILGWIAILIWVINILISHHDHVKQSLTMAVLGWVGVALILIGGGVNYVENMNQNVERTPASSSIQTHDSHK